MQKATQTILNDPDKLNIHIGKWLGYKLRKRKIRSGEWHGTTEYYVTNAAGKTTSHWRYGAPRTDAEGFYGAWWCGLPDWTRSLSTALHLIGQIKDISFDLSHDGTWEYLSQFDYREAGYIKPPLKGRWRAMLIKSDGEIVADYTSDFPSMAVCGCWVKYMERYHMAVTGG